MRSIFLGLLIAGAILLPPPGAHAAAPWGRVDTNFNANLLPFEGGYILDLVALPDDRLLVAGRFDRINGRKTHGLTLLNSNGVAMPNYTNSFALGTEVYSASVESDGSCLVAGYLFRSDGKLHGGMARVRPDGLLDEGFARAKPFASRIISLSGGESYFFTSDWRAATGLSKLLTNGLRDVGFQMPTNFILAQPNWAKPLVLQDGSLLAAGAFSTNAIPWSVAADGVYHFNADGSLDTNFIATNLFLSTALVQLNDGRILSGSTSQFGDTAALRLFSSSRGERDLSFHNPLGTNSLVRHLVTNAQGSIFVVGSLNDTNGQPLPPIIKINSLGAIDPGFQPEVPTNAYWQSIVVHPSGKISFATYFGTVGRLLANGAVDTNFATSILTYPEVRVVRPAPEGKVLASAFDGSKPGQALRLERLTANGSADPSFAFSSNSNLTSGRPPFDLLVNDNGSGLLFGVFLDNQGDLFSFASFDSNGVLQASGVTNLGLALYQGDQRITKSVHGGFVTSGGRFQWPGFAPMNDNQPLAKFLPDGQPDPSFVSSATFHLSSFSLNHLVDSADRIVVSGELYATNGQALPSIVRLNTNGSLDHTFNYSPTTNIMRRLLGIQRSGGIIAGQNYESFFDDFSKRGPALVRLRPNGLIDPAFVPQLGNNSWLQTGLIQSDDRILVGGQLFDTNGNYLSSVVRLEPDGALDESFHFDSETNAWVQTLCLMENGDVIAGGQFGLAGGLERMGLVRLHSVERPRLQASPTNPPGSLTLTGNTGRSYELQWSTNLTNWITFQTVTNTSGKVIITDPGASLSSNRQYRAVLVNPAP